MRQLSLGEDSGEVDEIAIGGDEAAAVICGQAELFFIGKPNPPQLRGSDGIQADAAPNPGNCRRQVLVELEPHYRRRGLVAGWLSQTDSMACRRSASISASISRRWARQ